MSQQSINLGSGPNIGDGDQLRVGGAKINANFTELYLAVNNANLLAFSGLIGAADRFPYFTGVGALSLATISAYSRQLLALADAAAWRGAGGLGLGTVSTLNTGATGASLVQSATADAAQTAIGATALGKSLIIAASIDAAQTAIGATTVGKALILAASAAAGRTALALGTASTVNTGATGASLMAAATTDAAQTALGATVTGKALLTAADSAAGRTALALGDAATATLTTNRYDPTVGRVSRVGDAGWGAAGIVSIAAIDVDAVRTNGLYYVAINSGQGSLPVNQNGYVLCKTVTSDYAIQDYEPVAQGDRYTRILNNGVWTPWSKNFKQSNIVGTVSQSSGVPTGAVIERGTNVNGEFIKFADGTIDMWQLSPSLAHVANTDLVHTWTLPFPVVSVATAVLGLQLRTVNSTNTYVQNKMVGALTDVNTATFRSLFSAAQNYAFFYTCKGRWF